ncbi:MAG: histidine phosphatase family protein [Oscillospiraceae bacterium]|nr:histidine phosphatase family protein [Oscillospiraceae bacterium]
MKTYRLHLLRHGLTAGNLEGRYIGSTDLPLCPAGKEQLFKLKEDFSYPTVQMVFCSPLMRAKETAEILYPGVKLYELQDLREASFGEFEGKRAEDLVGSAAFRRWMDPQDPYQPEGGEHANVFSARTRGAFLKLFEFMMKADVTEAAAVTHGGVIMSMLAQAALPQRPASLWACDPGCGWTVRCTPAMLMRDEMAEAVAIAPAGYGEKLKN